MRRGRYDAIVVGASFAGLAVARELRGEVLLLDRYEVGTHPTSACGTPLCLVERLGVKEGPFVEGSLSRRDRDILVVGGYGTVGRRIAANLAPAYPSRVVIAGRHVDKGSRVAFELGHGVRARHIDVSDRHSVDRALEGVGIVMSCVAQPETPHLLLASVSRGCGYTDIAPTALKRPPYPDRLKAEAVKTGARIILGAGLVPGISNILAREGADRVGPVDAVLSTCLLSLGDEYGPDSKGYVAEEIGTPFKAMVDGKPVLVKPFTGPAGVEFASPLGTVTAYRFPFSDQVSYPETLGARTAVSRLALLPPWVPRLLSVVVPLVGTAFAGRRSGTNGRLGGLMDWLKRKYKGLDWWGVHVEVRGATGIHQASVQGHGQAGATALGASAFVRALVEGEVDRPGIWTAEQVVPVGPFLARLAAHGLVPTVYVRKRAHERKEGTSMAKDPARGMWVDDNGKNPARSMGGHAGH